MRTRYSGWIAAALFSAALAACGDKVPESVAAKKLGNAPKEIIDKATTDANQALKQGAERARDADAKN